MRTHSLIIALGAATALAVGLIAPATAQAVSSADAAKPLDGIAESLNQVTVVGEDCTITAVGPKKISVGLKPVTVQFDVGTDCDDEDHSIEWAVTGDLYPGSSHVGWLGACTYRYAGPAVLTCPDGKTTLDLIGSGTFKGNQMAGQKNIHAYAFDDANGNELDDDSTSGHDSVTKTFDLLRRTSWESFNASPEPRKKGRKLKITGGLLQASWDSGTYESFAPTVKLQFRAYGQESYRTVATVQGTSTTVIAKRSGSFRFSYPGDATHAASTSRADYVKVTR